MNRASRVGWLVGSVALTMFMACTGPGEDVVDPISETVAASPSPTGCVPGKPLRLHSKGQIGTSVVESRCPSSKPLPVGASRKIQLLSIAGSPICRIPPDFAGSWWRVVKPYPRHVAHLGHEYVAGKMTLVTEDRARFHGPAVDVYMGRPGAEPIRVPKEGDLELNFERIDGPTHVGGCA